MNKPKRNARGQIMRAYPMKEVNTFVDKMITEYGLNRKYNIIARIMLEFNYSDTWAKTILKSRLESTS